MSRSDRRCRQRRPRELTWQTIAADSTGASRPVSRLAVEAPKIDECADVGRQQPRVRIDELDRRRRWLERHQQTLQLAGVQRCLHLVAQGSGQRRLFSPRKRLQHRTDRGDFIAHVTRRAAKLAIPPDERRELRMARRVHAGRRP